MASGDTKTEALLKALENGGEIDEIVGCCNTKMQDYILDNIDAVNSAKDAITNKGGTVGDTGLAGLAEEIETIPSGGGLDFGTVTYSPDYGQTFRTVTIQNISEYEQLATSEPTIGGETFNRGQITGVALGPAALYTPSNFLSNAALLTSLTGTENLRIIGDNFLSQANKFDQALDLRNVTTIGTNFLNYCSKFNKTLTLSSVTSIGNYFMTHCEMFAQSLTLPSSLKTVGTYFMNGCYQFVGPLSCGGPSSSSGISSNNYTLASDKNTVPMYTTGVTLTGDNASVWKNRLADRTSSPYRKLILSS